MELVKQEEVKFVTIKMELKTFMNLYKVISNISFNDANKIAGENVEGVTSEFFRGALEVFKDLGLEKGIDFN